MCYTHAMLIAVCSQGMCDWLRKQSTYAQNETLETSYKAPQQYMQNDTVKI